MSKRVVSAAGRGFLLLDSHPEGCKRSVYDLGEKGGRPFARRGERRPVALILGSSAGYGLAMTISGLTRYGIRGLGVCLEKAPGRRTGSPGWYNTAAAFDLAQRAGSDMTFLNADAFSDETKSRAISLLAKRYGRVDYLIYSIAAPRRTHPETGVTYSSVLKPIGRPATMKTLRFNADGDASLDTVTIDPATPEEVQATVSVMGGADWERWVNALADAGLLATDFRTVALTYIGSELTAPIYREGTIGAAKIDLEATGSRIVENIKNIGGAWACVNGAAVTQASTHIPGIALYLAILRSVLGDALQPPVQQAIQLWDQLAGVAPIDCDEIGRIRLDRWELEPSTQAEVLRRWSAATSENIEEIADVPWFRAQFRSLYGFDVVGIDYSSETETDAPWPTACIDID